MRHDTADRLNRARNLNGKAKKRANKWAKKADKQEFKREITNLEE